MCPFLNDLLIGLCVAPVPVYLFQFGLSLDKTMSDSMNPYLDSHQDKCILTEPVAVQSNGPIVFFKMDLKQNV